MSLFSKDVLYRMTTVLHPMPPGKEMAGLLTVCNISPETLTGRQFGWLHLCNNL